MNMIYFHILLVHSGGNACFEYLAFTVYGELHNLWNHNGCFWYLVIGFTTQGILQVTESI